MNREVGLGSYSLSHTAPVPDKPYGFLGRKASGKKKRYQGLPGKRPKDSLKTHLRWTDIKPKRT